MLSQDATYRASLFLSPSKSSIPSLLHPLIHKSFRTAIENSRPFYIAISGGSLPSFLSTLPESFIKADIDPQWDRWHVVLADERLVPSNDEDSNLRSIRRCFLDKVDIPSSQVYGIDESFLSSSSSSSTTISNSGIAGDVAAEYQTRVLNPLILPSLGISDNDERKIVLDCVLLGFGPDGHTCSLFPNHSLLDEKDLLVAGIVDSPKLPLERITLTFPVLNELCKDVIFVGAGESKKPILEATFESVSGSMGKYEVTLADPPVYPCGMVRPRNGSLNWVVDADAAPSVATSKM